MQESQVLNNKGKGRTTGACSHVLTFESHAEHTSFKCVNCGYSESVRNFN